MSRRSDAEVRAKFRDPVAEWQRNPFGDTAATNACSEMSGGVQHIDERLGKIAAEWPDTEQHQVSRQISGGRGHSVEHAALKRPGPLCRARTLSLRQN